MMKSQNTISVTKFRSHCLSLFDEVADKKITIVVMKRGTPLAKIVPSESPSARLFGALKGSTTTIADITKPLDVIWNADTK